MKNQHHLREQALLFQPSESAFSLPAACGCDLAQGGFFVRQGDYICTLDYQRLYGTRCFSCDEFIEGEVVSALGKTYHPDCFVCAVCRYVFYMKLSHLKTTFWKTNARHSNLQPIDVKKNSSVSIIHFLKSNKIKKKMQIHSASFFPKCFFCFMLSHVWGFQSAWETASVSIVRPFAPNVALFPRCLLICLLLAEVTKYSSASGWVFDELSGYCINRCKCKFQSAASKKLQY